MEFVNVQEERMVYRRRSSTPMGRKIFSHSIGKSPFFRAKAWAYLVDCTVAIIISFKMGDLFSSNYSLKSLNFFSILRPIFLPFILSSNLT